MKRIYCLPLLALALIACTSAPKNSLNKSSQRSITAQDFASSSNTKAAWPTQDWWAALNDEQLNRCIQLAVSSSPDMQVVHARLAQALATTQATDAASSFSANLGLDATRQLYTSNGLVPPPFAGSYRTSGNLLTNFSYSLDFWGKNRSLLEAAQGRQAAALAQTYDAAGALATAVAKTYFQWQFIASRLALLNQNRDAYQRLQNIYQLRVDAGLEPSTALHAAQSDVAVFEQQRANLQAVQQQTFYQLRSLLGNHPDFKTLSAVKLPVLSNELPSNLPLDLVAHRPDLQAAKANVESGLKLTAAAEADFYPNINLSSFFGFSSIGLGNLLLGSSKTMGVTPAIHLPIFDKARLQSSYAKSVADVDLAIAQYDQTLVHAIGEINDASVRISGVRNETGFVTRQIKAQEQEWKNAQSRQQQGLADGREVARQELALLQTQDKLLSLVSRNIDAQLDLTKALGGGYAANFQSGGGYAAKSQSGGGNAANPIVTKPTP